jgi:hypothetical protein
MNLMLNQQGKENLQSTMAQDSLQMPGMPNFVQGGGSGDVHREIAPVAMQFMQDANTKSTLRGTQSGPTSSDMIPAVHGLSNLEVSFGSGSDVSMQASDSVLGKRTAEGDDVPVQKLELSLGLGIGGQAGGKQKRWKKGTHAGQGDKRNDAADSVAARTRKKTSTRISAPGNLTRPQDGARQAQ